MGLAERRITVEFQQNVFPGVKKQIDEAVFELVRVKHGQLSPHPPPQ